MWQDAGVIVLSSIVHTNVRAKFATALGWSFEILGCRIVNSELLFGDASKYIVAAAHIGKTPPCAVGFSGSIQTS